MLLDSGVAVVWRGHNTAPAGSLPKPVFDQQYFRSYYGDKTVGIARFYTAKGQNDRADLLVEIERNAGISTADRCELLPAFDAAAAGYYKILQVQHVTNEDGQPATDLTLERIDAIDEP